MTMAEETAPSSLVMLRSGGYCRVSTSDPSIPAPLLAAPGLPRASNEETPNQPAHMMTAPLHPSPQHLGIMLDGNGRWARRRQRPRLLGHAAGADNVRPVLAACARCGIRTVSLYVFSTENWRRPADEVRGLFRIVEQVVDQEALRFRADGVQFRHLGSLEGIPPRLAGKIRDAVQLTRDNRDFILGIAFNYGGRADIVSAIQRIRRDQVPAAQVTEELVNDYLSTAGLPDIDLIIRTAGDWRLSNFFLWQSAHALFYSTTVLWPDFDEAELRKALQFYATAQATTSKRKRAAHHGPVPPAPEDPREPSVDAPA
jgi:undecaprenyl diphosphate synthase